MLVKETLKASLLALYTTCKTTEMTENDFADQLATILVDFFKTATIKLDSVTVNTGIPVSCPPYTGATTSPGTLAGTGTVE